MCTSGIFVVVDAIYQQVFLVELHVALYTLIIRIPGTDGRFVFLVFLIFGIHRLTDVIFGVLLYYILRFFSDIFVAEAGRNEISVQTVFQHIIR